jgi:hypothetical protein
MTEFKIQVDDKVVNDFGKDLLERFFQDFYSKALLKLAASEILKDLDNNELHDESWQSARERAWHKHGQYFINVIAND